MHGGFFALITIIFTIFLITLVSSPLTSVIIIDEHNSLILFVYERIEKLDKSFAVSPVTSVKPRCIDERNSTLSMRCVFLICNP